MSQDVEKRLQNLREELKKENTIFNSYEHAFTDPKALATAAKIDKLEQEIKELTDALAEKE